MPFFEYHGTLEAGGSIRVSKTITSRFDPTAQYLMASPIGPSRLVSSRYSKKFDTTTDSYIYSVSVSNQGVATDFYLQGGKLN